MSVGSVDEWASDGWWHLWGEGDGHGAAEMLPCLQGVARAAEAEAPGAALPPKEEGPAARQRRVYFAPPEVSAEEKTEL